MKFHGELKKPGPQKKGNSGSHSFVNIFILTVIRITLKVKEIHCYNQKKLFPLGENITH